MKKRLSSSISKLPQLFRLMLLFCTLTPQANLLGQVVDEVCSMQTTVTNIRCQNISTPDILDDTWTFDLLVQTPGSGYWKLKYNNNQIESGAYGTTKTIYMGKISDYPNGELTFIVENSTVATCKKEIKITKPAPCSPNCEGFNFTNIRNVTCNGTSLSFCFDVVGTGGKAWSSSIKWNNDPNDHGIPLETGTGDRTNVCVSVSDANLDKVKAFDIDHFLLWGMIDNLFGDGCEIDHSTAYNCSTCTAPIPTIGSNSPVCVGGAINLASSGGTTYSWTGPGFSNSTQNPSISGATLAMGGVYQVTVGNGTCTATANTSVRVTTCTVSCTPPSPPTGVVFNHVNFNNNSVVTGPICSEKQTYNFSVTATGCTGAGEERVWYSYENGQETPITPQPGGNIIGVIDGTSSLTYRVYCKKGECRSTFATGTVTVLPKPIPTIGSNSPICVGGTINLTSSGGTTYSWTGPGFSNSTQNPSISGATLAMGGVYQVTVGNGTCTSTANTSVRVTTCTVTCTAPPAPTGVVIKYTNTNNQAVITAPICSNQGYSVTFTATGCDGGELLWYHYTNGQELFEGSSLSEFLTTPLITYIPPNSSTTFRVYCKKNGCVSTSFATGTVSIVSPPVLTIGSNSPVCVGNPISVSVTPIPAGTYTYAWTGPGFTNSTQNPQVSSSATLAMGGVYQVTVGNGTCTSTASTSVQVTNCTATCTLSSVSITPANSQLSCTNGSVPLFANANEAGAIYEWTLPNGTKLNTQNISATLTGTYIVKATKNNCIATATIIISCATTNPLTITRVCLGNTLKVKAEGCTLATTYEWSGSNGFVGTGQEVNVGTSSPTITYTVTATLPSGCKYTAQVSGQTCGTQPCTLCVKAKNVRCTNGQLYMSVEVTGTGGQKWSAFIINAAGQQIPVTGLSGITGDGTHNIGPLDIALLGEGFAIWIMLDDDHSCVRDEYVAVPCKTTPNCNLLGTVSNELLQNGNLSFTINVSGGSAAGYTAYTNFGTQANGIYGQNVNLGPFNTSQGVVSVLLVDKNNPNCFLNLGPVRANCDNPCNLVLTKPTISANPNPVCLTTPLTAVTLTADGCATQGATTHWVGPYNGQGTTATVTPSTTTTYFAYCKKDGCISGVSSIQVVVNPNCCNYTVQAGSNSPVCLGTPINITSTPTPAGTYTYVWAGPNNFSSTTQSPQVSTSAANAMTGTYTVTVTKGTCTVTQTVIVSIKPVCTATCTNTVIKICVGESVELTGDAGYTNYQWYKNSISPANAIAGATSQKYITNQSGTYYYTATAAGGCPSQSCCGIVVEVLPPITLQISSNSPACIGTAISVSVTPSPVGTYTYAWAGPNNFSSNQQNPQVSNSATLAMAGTYSVTVNNGTCTATTTTRVDVNPCNTCTISVTAGNNGPKCEGGNVQLSSTPSIGTGITYAWTGPNGYTSIIQNPVINNVKQATHQGIYTVKITVNGTCTATATTSITVTKTYATVAIDHIECQGKSITLTALAGASYLWVHEGTSNVISTNQSIIVTQTGAYEVTVRDAQGCIIAHELHGVGFMPAPTVVASASKAEYCVPERVSLFAQASSAFGTTFSWAGPNGYTSTEQNPIINNSAITHTGIYTVKVSTQGVLTCTSSATVSISVKVCNTDCNIIPTVSDILCNDKGTPANPADDTFTFKLKVTANQGNNFVAFITPGGTSITGTQGQDILVGPFKISDGQIKLKIHPMSGNDAIHPCFKEITVTPPAPCLNACRIDVSTNSICQNQGTVNPVDDKWTLTLTVTGANTGGTWTAYYGTTVLGTGGYAAGTNIKTFDMGLISNYLVSPIQIVVKDNQYATCTTSINAEVPRQCSTDRCQLCVYTRRVRCTDAGLFFDLIVANTGNEPCTAKVKYPNGTSQTILTSVNNAGTYSIGPLDLSKLGTGFVVWVMMDNDVACVRDEFVAVPCVETAACKIAATYTNVQLNNNNGTFTYDVAVTGTGSPNGWTAYYGNQNWSGNYNGAAVTVGPFPIAGGAVSIAIADKTSPKCIVNVGPVKPNCTPKPCTSIPAKPVLTALPAEICEGTCTTLSASGCVGGTIQWFGTLGGQVCPTVSTTYRAVCLKDGCMSELAEVTVSVQPRPYQPVVTTQSPTIICLGGSANLNAAGCVGGTIRWYKKLNINCITTPCLNEEYIGNNPVLLTPTETALYVAKCKIGDCESVASSEVKVTVDNLGPITATADKPTICSADNVTLTVSNCYGLISWNTGSSTVSITKHISETTTFTVSCTSGACKRTANVTVTVNGVAPSITASATPSAICKPQNVLLIAEGCIGGTVTWSNGLTGTNVTTYVNQTTSYTAKCTIGTCTSTATVTVKVGEVPTFLVSANPRTICVAQNVSLSATGCAGGTVTWSNGQTGATILAYVTQTSTFTATCKVGGCEVQGSVVVSLIPSTALPPIVGGGGTVCAGQCITLSAVSCAGTIIWSDPTAPRVCPSITTTYKAKCKVGDCESDWSSGVTVTVKPANSPDCGGCNLPKPSISPVSVCLGESIQLCATNCSGTFEWSNGQTGSCISINPNTTATNYTVRCKVGDCYSPVSDPAQITIVRPTLPLISCSNTSICSGESAILSAVNCNGTVNWYKQVVCITTPCNPILIGSGNPFTITPDGTTTYVAKCKIGNCESEASNEITIRTGNTLSAPLITADVASICKGGVAILKSTPCVGTILWSDGQTGLSINVSPTVDTDYTAICQTDKCKSNKSNILKIKVGSGTINPPIVTCGKETICEGESVAFKGHNCDGGIVTWYANGVQVGTGITISFTPMVTTNYTATCSMNGCTSGHSSPVAKITVINAASVTITANRTELCGSETATLTATACSGTVTWFAGSTQVGTGQTHTTNDAGNYTAKCSGGECPSKASNPITIIKRAIDPPIPIIENKTVCLGSEISLDAGCANPTWSNGATGNPIKVKPTALTTITARCPLGCGVFATKQWNISVKEKVLPIITCKEKVCKGESVAFGITGCVGIPTWSNGVSGEATVITFNTVGEQTVKVKCMTDCGEAETVKIITVSDDKPATLPSITASKESICAGQPVTLTVQNCDSPIWSTNETKASISVSPSITTKYTVKCKFVSACVSGEQTFTAEKTITVIKVDAPELTCASDEICPGESITISAAGCAGTLTWSTGASTSSITVKPSTTTTYTAICKVGDCVSLAGSKQIKVGSGTVLPPVLACGREIICPGDEVIFTAYACTGIINWRSGTETLGTGKSLTVKPTKTTTYTAVCKNGNCTSPAATPITITVTASCNETVDVCINKVGDKTTAKVGDEVTYTVVVKNKGPKEATNTEWCDTLPQGLTFLAATNCTYANGKICARIPSLANGDSSIFRYTVKVATVGKIVNKADIIRVDQKDANSQNNSSSFMLNKEDTQMAGDLLGLTKTAGTPKQLSTGVYEVPFTITVHNMGTNAVKNVQVKDDLVKAIPAGAVIMTNKTELTVDAGFTKNTKYDGLEDRKMLDANKSEIPAGAKRNIYLKVVVDVSKATASKLVNEAQLEAGMDGNCKDDSNDSINPDPDNDSDPTNNNNPTTVDLPLPTDTGNPAGKGVIGLALSVVDSVRQDNGTYDVTYMGIVKNFGTKLLKNVQLSDSLGKTFMNGASCKVIGTPIVSKNSSLAVNQQFDGEQNTGLLLERTSSLAPSEVDTVLFSINIFTNGQTSPFLTNMHATAKLDSIIVKDISTNGVVPNPEGNTPTAISFPDSKIDGLSIPDGLSPNGDGVNDVFVIKGATKPIEFKVYNRWGNLVYQQENYKNDWKGECNTGIMLGSDTGLPDGTYYYYAKVGDAKPIIRFVMIAR